MQNPQHSKNRAGVEHLLGMQEALGSILSTTQTELKMERPFDPAIPLLGMYVKGMKPEICLFLAALFKTGRGPKQAKGPSADGLETQHFYATEFSHERTATRHLYLQQHRGTRRPQR